MVFKILDLFAGAGGLSLGFEMVKDKSGNSVFELYRAVEIDKDACRTLRARFPEEKVIEGDITDKKIHKKIIKECKGKVSIIMGGIPCQSFSLIGPRTGYGKNNDKYKEDNRDNLYREFRDIVTKIRPNIVIIENVKGILSKRDKSKKRIIETIISDFEKIGYNFRNDGNGEKIITLNSADFGVPQKRERVILVGIKKSWKKINFPCIKPTHYDPKSSNAKEFAASGLLPYVTIHEAIGDLPEIKPKITKTGLSKIKIKRVMKKNIKINNGSDEIIFNPVPFNSHSTSITKQGKDFLFFVRPNGYEYINYHIARSHQITDIKLFELLLEGEIAKDFLKRKPKTANKLIKYKMSSFVDKYRKQKSDEPCTTLFAHLEKDGNRFIHPTQARTITPREAARIQSFPDDIPIEGSLGKKFKQIGNAVPPLLSKYIALNVAKILY